MTYLVQSLGKVAIIASFSGGMHLFGGYHGCVFFFIFFLLVSGKAQAFMAKVHAMFRAPIRSSGGLVNGVMTLVNNVYGADVYGVPCRT